MTRKAKKGKGKKKGRKTTFNWLRVEFSREWLNCHSSCFRGLEKKPLPYLGFCIWESLTLDLVLTLKEGGCKKPREEVREDTGAHNLSAHQWGLLLTIDLLVLSAACRAGDSAVQSLSLVGERMSRERALPSYWDMFSLHRNTPLIAVASVVWEAIEMEEGFEYF